MKYYRCYINDMLFEVNDNIWTYYSKNETDSKWLNIYQNHSIKITKEEFEQRLLELL